MSHLSSRGHPCFDLKTCLYVAQGVIRIIVVVLKVELLAEEREGSHTALAGKDTKFSWATAQDWVDKAG